MANKAPGKHFREGISLVEIFRMFPDDAAAEAWLTEQRWPAGVFCHYCGSTNVQSGSGHKTMPYLCREKECGKRFSLKTGTVMQSSKLGYQVWVVAMYLLLTNLKSVSSMKLHRDLEITQKSAWHLAHRLRKAASGETAGLFQGPVEVDETYFGGREGNKHAHKKQRLGRGGVGKAVVVGAKDRATNEVRAEVVKGTDAETLQGFVADHATPGATVYTDDAAAYKSMPFKHESVRHSTGEYVKEMAHTNGIESFWAMLKRAHKGTFHKISPKHLQRYVSEFSGKHNIRKRDTIDQMGTVARNMAGKRLPYQALVADNGLDSGARA